MPANAQLILSRIQAWNAHNPHARLDPNAVLAVSAQEGLGGGVGDQGTSFGPFQLHIGGAFPSGVTSKGQEQAWAWSPAGIDYALRHIASVAGGQSGARAVQAIVQRFERPANPSGEASRALASLGLPVSSAAGYAPQGRSGGGAAAIRAGAVSAPPAAAPALNMDALVALLLSKQFEPPAVDVTGPLHDPAVHYEAQPPVAPIDALSLARQYLDSTKGSFSNPGFAQYLHGLNGVDLPASTIGQAAAGTHTASPAAGDVAFFGSPPTHQGVVLDGQHFLHGTNGGAQLRVSSLAHPAYTSGLATVRTY
jgi:cell wall-associated NlpC family hydrolase